MRLSSDAMLSRRRTGQRQLLLVMAAVLFLMIQAGPARSAPPNPADSKDLIGDFDQMVASAGAQIPEFAGFYREGESKLILLMVGGSSTNAGKARAALAKALGAPDLASMQIQVLAADYSFKDLKTWHERISTEMLGMQNVVSNDIDEVSNRLAVGVEDVAANGEAVSKKISDLGVPLEAVRIVEDVRATPNSSLRDFHRPPEFIGGLQIDSFYPARGACTLGFIAVRQGWNGFTTNSHCGKLNELTGHGYAQPIEGVWPNNNAVGWEVQDNPGIECPLGRTCRIADVEFDRTLGDIGTPQRGRIARPTTGTTWLGATWRIIQERIPGVGESAIKIGRTTGSLAGAVSDTCKDILGTDDTYRLCSYGVVYSSAPQLGDSGGPVFQRYPGTTSDVRLLGMHWGADSSGTKGWYSPITYIQNSTEIGAVLNCDPGWPC